MNPPTTEEYLKLQDQNKDLASRIVRLEADLVAAQARGSHQTYVKMVQALMRSNRKIGWMIGAFSSDMTSSSVEGLRQTMNDNEQAIA